MSKSQPITNAKGQRICGATYKSGKVCQSTVLMTGGRCRVHGGASPRGLAHYSTGNRRYSVSLPAQIYEKVARHLEDKQLLELNDDIALITAMIEQAQEKLYQDAESLGSWRKLLLLREKVINAKTDEARGDAIKQMFGVIEQAERFISSQDEIIKLLDQRRRFVDSETNRKLKLSQGITLDQVGVFFHALASAVREEVEPDVLQRIQTRFERLSQTSRKLGIDAELGANDGSSNDDD